MIQIGDKHYDLTKGEYPKKPKDNNKTGLTLIIIGIIIAILLFCGVSNCF